MQKERINWIDNIKGFGILSVIIGHTILPNDLHVLIYTFHMPLFFLLSGYFLFYKDRPYIENLKNKAISLLVPFVIFNIFTFVSYDIGKIFLRGENFSINEFFEYLYYMVFGDRIDYYLWFLPCLFLSEMLLLLLPKKKSPKFLLLTFLSLSVVGSIVNYIFQKPLIFNLDIVLISSSFIILGNYLKQYNPKHMKATIAIALLVYIPFAYLSAKSTDFRGIDMYDCRFGNYLYFYIAAIAAIYVIFQIFKKLPNSKFLSFFGKNTMLIYCSHRIILNGIFQVFDKMNFLAQDEPTILYLRSAIAIVLVCMICIPLIFFVNKYCPFIIGKSFSISKKGN